MNEIFVLLGLQSWKPIVGALLLPPLPLVVLMLVGARMMYWRRGVAWLVMLLSAALLYLSFTAGVGDWLQRVLTSPPPAISAERIAELKRAGGNKTAIVVLGGGREGLAPEYGVSNLSSPSLARLNYGIWLARQTGLPIMYSGGVGWGDSPGVSEAEAAARIAAQDYGRSLKWLESESRDTRGNATLALAMLRSAGVSEVVLVTHGWHMRRSLRAFEAEASRGDAPLHITPAPMGLATSPVGSAQTWLPSAEGFARVRAVLHEAIGLAAGA